MVTWIPSIYPLYVSIGDIFVNVQWPSILVWHQDWWFFLIMVCNMSEWDRMIMFQTEKKKNVPQNAPWFFQKWAVLLWCWFWIHKLSGDWKTLSSSLAPHLIGNMNTPGSLAPNHWIVMHFMDLNGATSGANGAASSFLTRDLYRGTF
jgi:hypothetical protein